jgi:hypothetical protein
MMNRRKLFSFLATAPVATVIGAKAAMDANWNDVAPLVGDFPTFDELLTRYRWGSNEPIWESIEKYNAFVRHVLQDRAHNSRSQRFRS